MTIPPRTLSGFRDFLPEAMSVREFLIDAARNTFRAFGFQPMDTPVLEYFEILNGKGSEETNRQVYQFHDHGDRHVGMRFDLTVPLARYIAQHQGRLIFPFKRYHIGKVWRGERPQRGRYREFMQCDFDTIGTRSINADIEMILVMHDLMQRLGVKAFTIRVNHRQILNGLLESVGLHDQATEVLRALDKLDKEGAHKVGDELQRLANASDDQVQRIIEFVSVRERSASNSETLDVLRPMLSRSETGTAGLNQLLQVVSATHAAGIEPYISIDISIARGLDYYTGLVVETTLNDLPEIGSVCSGGRYDNLIGSFARNTLPGIGASLGLDRLFAALDALGIADNSARRSTVFLPFFEASRLDDYLALAGQLRSCGFAVDLFPEPKKLGTQLKFATARQYRVAVIVGADEFAENSCQIKDLDQRKSQVVSLADGVGDLAAALKAVLAANPT